MKVVRFIAVGAAIALVGATFVSPAVAAKKGKAPKCGQFAPGVEEAAEAEVLKVTPKATEAKPLVIEYEHGPALWPKTEHLYFNIQIFGPSSGLYVRQEFSDRHDLDLYLFDGAGEEVASSGAFNPTPVAVGPLDFTSGGNGGTNYESINGYPVATCEGFTIDSTNFASPGTATVLKIWLGEPAAAEE